MQMQMVDSGRTSGPASALPYDPQLFSSTPKWEFEYRWPHLASDTNSVASVEQV